MAEACVQIRFEGGRKSSSASIRLVLDAEGDPFGLEVFLDGAWIPVEAARLGRLVPPGVFDGGRLAGFVVLRACGPTIRIPVEGVGGRPFEAWDLGTALGADGFDAVLAALGGSDV